MMRYNTILIVMAIVVFSCKENKKPCDATNFKNLKLVPVNASLMLPEYIITDTVRCCDASQVFSRDLHSIDSSLITLVGIKSYEKNQEAMPKIDSGIVYLRKFIEMGQDSMRLLTQTIKTIGSTKIGYLKYIDERRKRYAGRIFFNRGFMFVDISLFEKYIKNEADKHTLIDCILENIIIK